MTLILQPLTVTDVMLVAAVSILFSSITLCATYAGSLQKHDTHAFGGYLLK